MQHEQMKLTLYQKNKAVKLSFSVMYSVCLVLDAHEIMKTIDNLINEQHFFLHSGSLAAACTMYCIYSSSLASISAKL